MLQDRLQQLANANEVGAKVATLLAPETVEAVIASEADCSPVPSERPTPTQASPQAVASAGANRPPSYSAVAVATRVAGKGAAISPRTCIGT